jgi:hypothetical protein
MPHELGMEIGKNLKTHIWDPLKTHICSFGGINNLRSMYWRLGVCDYDE